MKSVAITSLCALAACLCVVVCSQPAESQEERQASSDNKLNNLLAERRDTLHQLVEWVVAQHEQGDATLDNVIQAKNDLLDSELDIATTKTDRIRIRQEQVENLRYFENFMASRHENGSTTIIELLVVKAARLQAEIKLRRE